MALFYLSTKTKSNEMKSYKPLPHDKINDTQGELIWFEVTNRFTDKKEVLQIRIGTTIKLINKKKKDEAKRIMKNGPGWAAMMYDCLGKQHRVDSVNSTKRQVHLECGFWWPLSMIDWIATKEINKEDNELEDKFIYDMY